MHSNVGKADRMIRIVLGLVILMVGVLFGSWWGLLGFVPLITGLGEWCPIYATCNISTKRRPIRARPL